MNGVIDLEIAGAEKYIKFASPFVQKKIFNRFSDEIFNYTGKLYEPFEDLSDVITNDTLNMGKLLKRYQLYLQQNGEWLLKDAPRRKDLRIFEAIYHFNLYRYLYDFLRNRGAKIYPEFPTGNGKIDLIIKHNNQTYGLELKSYTDETGYKKALVKAASYGRQLGLAEIFLVFFVEYVDDENRTKHETAYSDGETGVKVIPVFVETG
jgi:hypothetical protein